jgi:hypothetical protein
MIFMAFKGLTKYKYIAVAWIFHTLFDIFDPLIEVWFYFGAPTVVDWFKSKTTVPVGS